MYEWRSKDTRCAPVSRAWAAIQASFVGTGLPFFRRAAITRPKRSAVSQPTWRTGGANLEA